MKNIIERKEMAKALNERWRIERHSDSARDEQVERGHHKTFRVNK